MADGSGGEWSEVARVWSGERLGTNICGVDAGQCGLGGRAPVPPYPPHIWAGYEGCRSAWAFEARLRRPTGLKNRDQSVTGRPARAFEGGLGSPAVDALIPIDKNTAVFQYYT